MYLTLKNMLAFLFTLKVSPQQIYAFFRMEKKDKDFTNCNMCGKNEFAKEIGASLLILLLVLNTLQAFLSLL